MIKLYIILIILVILLFISLYYEFGKYENYGSNYSSDSGKKINKSCTLKLYYAPWCGFCKSLMPEWIKLEEFMNIKKNTHKSVKIEIVKINCDENVEKCNNIKGYPTIKLEIDGKEIEMDGKYQRNKESIIQFIEDNL